MGSADRRGGSSNGASDAERVAFDAFFRDHHASLCRLAFTLTGNREDADDVAGEAFAYVWLHWSHVRTVDHPLGYVRRIIVNMSADRVRRAVRERQGVSLMKPMMRWFYLLPDVGAAVDLHAAVLALPPGRRACVVLRYVLDLPEAEVSRTLGISGGTVKSQTAKGLAQLRGVLTRPDDLVVDLGERRPGTSHQGGAG